LFDELDLPLTVCLNAEVCEHHPRIVAAIKDHPHWAVLPHGLNNNTAGHRGLARDAERRLIEQTLAITHQEFGRMPLGFMVPNWSMTEDTFDLLLEAGVRYTTDWMNDDQPYWYELAKGKLLDVPYNLETNDFTLRAHRAPSGPRAGACGHRPLRPALAGRRDARPLNGDRDPLVHLGSGAPDQVRARVPGAYEGEGRSLADDLGRDLRVDGEPRESALTRIPRQNCTGAGGILPLA
jgi:peptidoglycan/xylan/chitin deacetylase (PgdA/CDA1 family)